MLGISRESLAKLQSQVADMAVESDAAFVADTLKAASAISAQSQLLVALVDSGQNLAVRENLVKDLFASHVGSKAIAVITAAIALRWAEDEDLIEALEVIAAESVFRANPAEVDQIEAEIFSFARAVETHPELQMALTNPAAAAAAKAALVRDLISAQVRPGTAQLLEHLAANLRGRRVDTALRALSEAAASARNRVVAEIKVATPLAADQSDRLAKVLGRLAGKEVSLNVVIDASIIGGVSVRLGDEVIDGTVRTRLDQARRALVG